MSTYTREHPLSELTAGDIVFVSQHHGPIRTNGLAVVTLASHGTGTYRAQWVDTPHQDEIDLLAPNVSVYAVDIQVAKHPIHAATEPWGFQVPSGLSGYGAGV